MNGSGGNCCNGKCVKADKLLWTGPHYTSVPVWDKDFSGEVKKSDMKGIGWCPNDPLRPKKEGEKCSVPTDCYHNMNGTGGNCCDGKCVKAEKMLWTGPHFTSVPVWDKDFSGEVKKSDMKGIGWCPNDSLRPKKEGESCSVPTDCYHNMNGTGGNCCEGKCVKGSAMKNDYMMNAILWCPNDCRGKAFGPLGTCDLIYQKGHSKQGQPKPGNLSDRSDCIDNNVNCKSGLCHNWKCKHHWDSRNIGESCTETPECRKGVCKNDKCTYLEVGETCGQDDDLCRTGVCVYGKCTKKIALKGRCGSDSCKPNCDHHCDGAKCIGWVCKHHWDTRNEGESCTETNECKRGMCIDDKCTLLENGSSCGQGSKYCKSNTCIYGKCVDPVKLGGRCGSGDCAPNCNQHCSDGECIDWVCKWHWNTRKENQSCTEDNECKEGVCKSGKCTYLKDGESCGQSDHKCKSGVCVWGKCTPKIALNERCGSDSCKPNCDYHCADGKCIDWKCKWHWDTRNEGESCTETKECKRGICSGNKCTLLANGSSCGQESKWCKSNTCIYGKCVDPVKLGGRCGSGDCAPNCNQHCSDGECIDWVCKWHWDTRNAGESCTDTRECKRGKCISNKCTLLENGSSCGQGSKYCKSNTCIFGKCVEKRKLGERCGSGDCAPNCNTHCTEGECLQWKCKFHWDSRNTGDSCTEDKECKKGRCKSGKCALLENGEWCGQEDKDCKSGICVDTKCKAKRKLKESCGSSACKPNCHYHCAGDAQCLGWKCKYHWDSRNIDQACTENKECKKGKCKSGKCKLLENEEACGQEDKDCKSGICVDGKCKAKRNLKESCGSNACKPNCDYHCAGDAKCLGWKCKYHWDSRNLDQACTEDKECKKGRCKSGKCRLLENNETCGQEDKDCKSGICVDGKCKAKRKLKESCGSNACKPNCHYHCAGDAKCLGWKCKYHWDSRNIDQACTENKECKKGKCKAGKCRLLKNEEACGQEDEDCESGICVDGKCKAKRSLGSSCGSNACKPNCDYHCSDGKCLGWKCSWKDNTRNLNDSCSKDSECKKGRCKSNKCKLLENNETCGQEDKDCKSGICVDGKCKAKRSLKESCGSNACKPNCHYHCAGDARCIDWKCKYDWNTRNIDQACTEDKECKKGKCKSGKCKLLENDENCGQVDKDCKSGICVDGKCKAKRSLGSSCGSNACKPNCHYHCAGDARCIDWKCKYDWNTRNIGQACTEDKECKKGECSGGKCSQRSLGASCTSHHQCGTGKCWDWVCAYDDYTRSQGSSCARNKDCSTRYCTGKKCAKKGLASSCNNHAQCSTGKCWDWVCAYDDYTRRQGWSCARNKDCSTRYCTGRKCSKKRFRC